MGKICFKFRSEFSLTSSSSLRLLTRAPQVVFVQRHETPPAASDLSFRNRYPATSRSGFFLLDSTNSSTMTGTVSRDALFFLVRSHNSKQHDGGRLTSTSFTSFGKIRVMSPETADCSRKRSSNTVCYASNSLCSHRRNSSNTVCSCFPSSSCIR